MRLPILPLLLAGLTALLPAGCDKSQPRKAVSPEVDVRGAAKAVVRESIDAIGETVPDQRVELVARVKGFLKKRNFDEGQEVKAGQVLFEIEPDTYIANVKAAEAELERARVTQANAQTDYDRQKKLIRQDAVSERTFDNASARKLEADADVKSAEAKLANANLDLAYTKITAPFDGWAGLADVSEGNLVGDGKTSKLATLVKTDPMRVEFVLNEMDILKLLKVSRDHQGDPEVTVRLFLQDGSEYPKPGKLAYWDNKLNTSTGTMKLQAIFPNPDGKLISGMFARIKIEGKKGRERLVVPVEAVMTDQAGDYLYILGKDGLVQRRTVKISYRDNRIAAIADNLEPGEKVITNGLLNVRPGSPAVASSPQLGAPAAQTPPAKAAGNANGAAK